MVPAPSPHLSRIDRRTRQPYIKSGSLELVIVEAWSEGFMVGGLIILIMITLANVRSGVLLHKLVLLELSLALLHGTFIFFDDPVMGWYLSSTAVLLYLSYNMHNVVNWIKIKPFLPRWGSRLYIGTVALAFPFWVAEMVLNFYENNNLGSRAFDRLRPWEALARDPWWLFTSCGLIYVIQHKYELSIVQLIRSSPRLCILLVAMFFSLVFTFVDIVITAIDTSKEGAINPYWKLALVFRCAADAFVLDDFKLVLDELSKHTFGSLNATMDLRAEGICTSDLSHQSPGTLRSLE